MIAQKRRAATSGGELAFIDEGEGPAVLLLHGFPMSSFTWRNLAPLLSARLRVIAPDLLGCGDSDKPEDARLDIRAQAGYVRELLAGLGIDTYAVIGASHGGGVAQLLALDGGGVDAMVLLNPICFDHWLSGSTRDVQRNEAGVVASPAVVEALLRTAFDLGIGHRARVTEEVLGEFIRPWREDPASFFRWVRAIDGVGLTGREADLASLEMPVLILWGEDDAFMPVQAAEQLNEAIPSSTLGLLPGCGHLLMEDAAETIGPMVYEYLRARYLKAPHGHEGIVTLQLERRPPWVDLTEN